MKGDYRVLDADVHVIEPMSMWAEHIEPKFHGREPQPEDLAFGMIVDGIPINTSDRASATSTMRPARCARNGSWGSSRRSTPRRGTRLRRVAQLADMDIEGVDLGFLYPSFGLFVIASDEIDADVATAVARAYNDWMADFCAADPARLAGSA